MPRKKIATTAARHGGSTFHMNIFSIVNAALEVAVIRLVSTAGNRSEKKLGECMVRWRNRSRRTSPVTCTNVKLAIKLATRQKRLSAAINDKSMANAVHGDCSCDVNVSTRSFTPY